MPESTLRHLCKTAFLQHRSQHQSALHRCSKGPCQRCISSKENDEFSLSRQDCRIQDALLPERLRPASYRCTTGHWPGRRSLSGSDRRRRIGGGPWLRRPRSSTPPAPGIRLGSTGQWRSCGELEPWRLGRGRPRRPPSATPELGTRGPLRRPSTVTEAVRTERGQGLSAF